VTIQAVSKCSITLSNKK